MGKKCVFVLLVLLFVLSGVSSAENLLVNPSFELPVIANNASVYGTPEGWTKIAGSSTSMYLYRPNPPGAYPPSDSAQRFIISSSGNGILGQDIGMIEADTVYTFTVDVLPFGTSASTGEGTISFRTHEDSQYIVLASSKDFDYEELEYRVWNTMSLSWDSTDYPQFWGKPLTVVLHVQNGRGYFFDNCFAAKAATSKRVRVTQSLPEVFAAVSETGGTYSFDLELLQAPVSDVSVVLSESNPDDPNDVSSQLAWDTPAVFTAANWNSPQTVTVSAVDDLAEESVMMRLVHVDLDTADPAFSTLDPNNLLAPVAIKVIDNDTPLGDMLYNGSFEAPVLGEEGVSIYSVPDGWTGYQALGFNYLYDPPASSSIQPTDGVQRFIIFGGDGVLQPIGCLIEANTTYAFEIDVYGQYSTYPGDDSIKLACYDTGDILDPNIVILATTRLIDEKTASPWKRVAVTWNSASAPEFVGKKLAVIVTSRYHSPIVDNGTVTTTHVDVIETDDSTVVWERPSLGNTDTYSISLMRAPASDVIINAVADANQITVDPSTLTFTAANWQTPQTVTVTAVDDAVDEGAAATVSSVYHTAFSSDPHFDGAFVDAVKVFVKDDDHAALLFADAEALEVSEDGATDQYSVSLLIAPTADVTVSLAAGSDLTVEPSELVFTTTNWAIPQTVTIAAVDDAETEDNPEAVYIGYTLSTEDELYAAVSAPATEVFVIDNDECGTWGFHPGDLNEDCYVNLADLQVMAASWLNCSHPGDPTCTTALEIE